MLIILVGVLFILRGYNTGEVEPLFQPTPSPTRTSASLAEEGQQNFEAGNLNQAIDLYQEALRVDPNNAELWAELARVQAYSYRSLTNSSRRMQRVNEALESADKAVEANSESSTAHAVRAFVLDQIASETTDPTLSDQLLVDAEITISVALEKERNNVLAMAYAAEIYNDQFRWDLARQYINLAVEADPDLMDVQRVLASYRESQGDYQGAIAAYERAIELAPNLTFLYINCGVIYRHLEHWDTALEYFAKAVEINEQLGIEDPLPYVAIGKVYAQTGEFYIASLNARRALQIDPYSSDLYGQLGMIYFKARNYETSIPALRCAVRGCDAQTTCEVRDCDPSTDPVVEIEPIVLEPNDWNTVVYYYTYGSVLAGLYRPVGKNSEFCGLAVDVLAEVREKFGDDETIMNIVGASEDICASYGITYVP